MHYLALYTQPPVQIQPLYLTGSCILRWERLKAEIRFSILFFTSFSVSSSASSSTLFFISFSTLSSPDLIVIGSSSFSLEYSKKVALLRCLLVIRIIASSGVSACLRFYFFKDKDFDLIFKIVFKPLGRPAFLNL